MRPSSRNFGESPPAEFDVGLARLPRAFLERVQNALREVDEGIWAARLAADEMSGVVRVGTTHTFNMRIIPRCVSLFLSSHPSVRVNVMEMSGDDLFFQAIGRTGETIDAGAITRVRKGS